MNAPSISRNELSRADNRGDSDSDSSDEIPDYYQPISSDNGEGNDDENLDSDSNSNEPNINGYHTIHPHSHSSLSNGHDYQNGIRSLNLISEDQEERESEEHEEEEEEEERRRAESDWAIRRAFEEDESRRNAPLPAENAVRVMEAMRGVSFSGLAPDWASRIPEDHWLDQVRRLRQPPHSAA